jgi:copper transport protein
MLGPPARAVVILALAVSCVVVSTTAASAHAALLRATPSSSQTLPRAPDQVALLFSEPLDPVFSSVRVQDASGQTIDSGDSHVDPENSRLLVASLRTGLSNGVYIVRWRSLSAIDVHPDEGEYALFVGVPVTRDAAPVSSTPQITATPETTFGRWWFYLAASLFGGVLGAWKLVLGPLLSGGRRDAQSSARRRTYRLILTGGALLVVGTLFSAVAQAAAAANVPMLEALGRPLSDLLLRGRFAAIWWPRLGLEVVSLLLITFGGIDDLAAECALATLPAVLLTSALTSHGAALPAGAAPGILIDWLHIVGATAWVGGLIALAAFLPATRGASDSGAMLGRLVRHFGRFAVVASMLVLLSGVLQGALEVGSWVALVSTLYGQLLMLKAGLLVAMLLLAARNDWRARANAPVALARVREFNRGVRLELTLGLVVFAVAAMLSGTPPSPIG